MAIYKLKTFARFARSENIADQSLKEAIERAAKGLVDADLGGGLIKQRIARKGQGRSGGYRMMIAFRSANFSVFLFGFAKIDESMTSSWRFCAASPRRGSRPMPRKSKRPLSRNF